MWSAGKLTAVRRWAAEHGIDLASSYAYSDSVYDTPLLAAVGHPFVVNPDPRLAVMAAARRWPIIDLSAAGKRLPVIPVVNMEIQRLALSFTHPLFFPFAKFDIDGVENIPEAGSGDHRRQPPQLLRPHGDRRHHRPHRPHRALPRQEGGLRRPDHRPDRRR